MLVAKIKGGGNEIEKKNKLLSNIGKAKISPKNHTILFKKVLLLNGLILFQNHLSLNHHLKMILIRKKIQR